jgi:uncharacterized protein (DUF1330 family)
VVLSDFGSVRNGSPDVGGLDQTAEARLSEMSKGYWVAFADVSDAEGHKPYIAENAKAFRKYGGRFLTRGGAYEAPEGKPRSRTVVIEFPTYEAALECCRSPEYAKAMALRQGKSVMDLAIVQGYDGPQPSDS